MEVIVLPALPSMRGPSGVSVSSMYWGSSEKSE